jgi:hypothetical protein
MHMIKYHIAHLYSPYSSAFSAHRFLKLKLWYISPYSSASSAHRFLKLKLWYISPYSSASFAAHSLQLRLRLTSLSARHALSARLRHLPAPDSASSRFCGFWCGPGILWIYSAFSWSLVRTWDFVNFRFFFVHL